MFKKKTIAIRYCFDFARGCNSVRHYISPVESKRSRVYAAQQRKPNEVCTRSL